MENQKSNRRGLLKKTGAMAAALFGGIIGTKAAVAANPEKAEVTHGEVVMDQDVPLFSGHTSHGNLVFIAGKGYHEEGDIAVHTDKVLGELEKELIKAGSSMDKVLKVNVYLHDLEDYKGMNAVYRGRFGKNPPVRTTVAVYGGVPGKSLVEIDCIAYKD
ncbi:MAG: RidA family protein [Cyclobacteriaceae bacterium]|nr:RidA family protein [Cyclobacteriaceae bacterium]